MINVMFLNMVISMMIFRVGVNIKYLVLGFSFVFFGLLFSCEEFFVWFKFVYVIVVFVGVIV